MSIGLLKLAVREYRTKEYSSNMSQDLGILYVATGKKYILELLNSAASARRTMPDISMAIYVDDKSQIPEGLFDHIRIIKNPTYSTLDKIEPLIETPFEKTLFLDTDTLFMNPVYELSDLLDRFDIAFCHAPWRICVGKHDIAGCPSAFPEPNSGVILYKSSASVFDCFRMWSFNYKEMWSKKNKKIQDQPALRKTIYESSLNLTVLPPEYNLRTHRSYFVGGNAEVKIIHDRGKSLQRAISKLKNHSSASGPRVERVESKESPRKQIVKKVLKVTNRVLKRTT